MSQQNPFELAKQGNPNAIAALINRSLKPKGITAEISRKNDCLSVILESNEDLPQKGLTEFIRNTILELGITEINTIEVFGRQVGSQVPTWSQTISLKEQSLPLINQKTISELQDLNSQNSESSANPEFLLLQDAAKKGDPQAISRLVSQAIGPQNIIVEATVKMTTTLCLRIYPPATIQPQSCIQAIIRILNDIQPDNIFLVSVIEFTSDKTTLVWSRMLVLKNGKFVDNTTSSKSNIKFGAIIFLIIGLVGYCALPKESTNTSPTAISNAPTSLSNTPMPVQEQSPLQPSKWYQGGTLHNAGALEWQQASYENKLATCADLVSSVWDKKMLKPSVQNQIKSMDDIKILAQELVTQMDAAMKEVPNSEENKQIYTNQKVSDIAALLMISMGWVK